MPPDVSLNAEQFRQLLSALNPGTSQSLPIFLSALSAMIVGILLESVRRYLDKSKDERRRNEHEVELLNVATVGIAHNLTLLIHASFQQILPHFDASRAARAELEKRKGNRELMADLP